MVENTNKSKTSLREEEILKFWGENKIFEKSLNKPDTKGEFVFYEGPPTANGKPGIHHLEARAFKDIIPRYKTMQGYHVRRKGGWDTHGLPVELQVEKQLGLKSKKEIEKYGIAEFNKKCKESVWEYVDLWEKFTDRIGYWVDLKDPYITYKNEYIESLWNILKTVNDKKLLYKDYKVVPWCPRCGTALSSHELAQGYQDVKDLSVTVKFKIKSGKFKDKFLLAWTTTPWTLPGNVALAIGEKIKYKIIEEGEEGFILADENGDIFGKDLVGAEYEPLYPFMNNFFEGRDPESFAKAYKVYTAPFVNTEDGTGIVHTAVMYGQDDFVLGTKANLPKYHLVNEDGTFKEEMGFLAGRFVKDEETAVEIIKDLANRDLLFKKEKYEHSYPHCWRCKTPLIYYARDSWYIRMSELRDKLVKENENINWEPAHIKEGRFGEWLKDVKDWAISRERFWGTPLPVWQKENGDFEIIGSIDDLKKHTKKSGNKYFAMRHGEAGNNIETVYHSDASNRANTELTERGKEQVKTSIGKFKTNVDLIISSPYERSRQTAAIVCEHLGYPLDKVVYDDRIYEWRAGTKYNGKSKEEFRQYYDYDYIHDLQNDLGDGESFASVIKRVGEFIYDIESEYQNKNIFIVAHSGVMRALNFITNNTTISETEKGEPFTIPENASIGEIKFIPFPHNENYELDLHKPYIDEVELVDEKGNKMTRVKEVMDVWFDSGAMPFAQDGLSNIDKIKYPADFISEAIDQTRGWFYTLHAIGILMGKGRAYKNVICLGHILDAEGKKMSKSLGNIVDPWLMIDKYGVDALRLWMYSVNQPGDSKNFDERTVDEVVKKVFNTLSNVLSFYLLYADKNTEPKSEGKNVLDRWIVSRLNQVLKDGTRHLEDYKVFEASRLTRDFINDFSTWYLRRSRDRFKSEDVEDKKATLSTTLFVLKELSKYMAPFIPFFAEDLYGKVRSDNDPESVHLSDWPKAGEIDEQVLEDMEEVRRIVSLALEKRNAASIKVRQPLSELRIKNHELRGKEEYLNLIKDEVNVKEVVADETIEGEVELDTNITEELKMEGDVREFVRAVQALRKEKGLVATDAVTLKVETDEKGKGFLEANAEQIKKPTNTSEIIFQENDGVELKIENSKLKIQIK